MGSGAWKRSKLVRLAVAATAVLATGSAAVVVDGCGSSPPPVTHEWVGPDPRPVTFNAVREATALRRTFGTNYGLSVETRPAKLRYSTLWPFSQEVNALIAVEALDRTKAHATRANDAIRSLGYYWDPGSSPPGYDSVVRPPLGHAGAKFYDDNMWVGLELLQAYRLHRDPALLHQAKRLFTLIKHGWDSNPDHAFPGGIFWTQRPGNHDRTIAANAGGAEFALELYLLTGKSHYLTWAQTVLSWINASLRSPDGLFWDHVDLQGGITHVEWSYNQGLMIGANTLLYVATGDQGALGSAIAIAQAALATDIADQPVEFDAIFYQNLMLLDSVAPNAAYRQALAAYAAQMESRVDSRTGLLRYKGKLDLVTQAGMTEINAYLAMALENRTGVWAPHALH